MINILKYKYILIITFVISYTFACDYQENNPQNRVEAIYSRAKLDENFINSINSFKKLALTISKTSKSNNETSNSFISYFDTAEEQQKYTQQLEKVVKDYPEIKELTEKEGIELLNHFGYNEFISEVSNNAQSLEKSKATSRCSDCNSERADCVGAATYQFFSDQFMCMQFFLSGYSSFYGLGGCFSGASLNYDTKLSGCSTNYSSCIQSRCH
jgi:hypothetical protein